MQRTRVCPWLLLLTREKLDEVLRWGHVSVEAVEGADQSLHQWGRADIWLSLTPMQHASLAARGLGWPWNGYDLRKMLAAGKYPPERPSRAQEVALVSSRGSDQSAQRALVRYTTCRQATAQLLSSGVLR